MRGFTLIELLVVISIIGFLSSIVLTSLSEARLKARDANLKLQLSEFQKLMELEYSDTGSYANLQKGWASNSNDCTAKSFGGNYSSKALSICNQLVSLSEDGFFPNPPPGGYRFHTGTQAGQLDPNDYKRAFSIIVYLPGKQAYFCIGSGGKSDDTSTVGLAWNQPGCYTNP